VRKYQRETWKIPHSAILSVSKSGPLMQWARYAAGIHLVRLIAGSLFRGSPLWSFYLRQNGARIGRRVYINRKKRGHVTPGVG